MTVEFSGFGIQRAEEIPVVFRMIHNIEVSQFMAYNVVLQVGFEKEEPPVEGQDAARRARPPSTSLIPYPCAFWLEAEAIAKRRGLSINALVSEIDDVRLGSLSAAIRLYVLDAVKSRAPLD